MCCWHLTGSCERVTWLADSVAAAHWLAAWRVAWPSVRHSNHISRLSSQCCDIGSFPGSGVHGTRSVHVAAMRRPSSHSQHEQACKHHTVAPRTRSRLLLSTLPVTGSGARADHLDIFQKRRGGRPAAGARARLRRRRSGRRRRRRVPRAVGPLRDDGREPGARCVYEVAVPLQSARTASAWRAEMRRSLAAGACPSLQLPVCCV